MTRNLRVSLSFPIFRSECGPQPRHRRGYGRVPIASKTTPWRGYDHRSLLGRHGRAYGRVPTLFSYHIGAHMVEYRTASRAVVGSRATPSVRIRSSISRFVGDIGADTVESSPSIGTDRHLAAHFLALGQRIFLGPSHEFQLLRGRLYVVPGAPTELGAKAKGHQM